MNNIVNVKINGVIKQGTLLRKGFIIGNFMYTVEVEGKVYNLYTLV